MTDAAPDAAAEPTPDAPALLRIAEGVAEIRLNRPERMNAITVPMLEVLAAHAETIAADRGVRAVVLTGAGRSFCAGLDTANFETMLRGGGGLVEAMMTRSHGAGNLFQHAALMWRNLPVPVIAAINGHCLGGGLQIALGADMRIAAPDAGFSVMEMKWGLVPDMGGMVALRHLVRGDIARRLVYTAETIPAAEAVAIGLATETAEDPEARAFALARGIAGRSPSAIRAAKRLMLLAESGAPDPEILLAESAEQKALIGGADQVETIRAQMEGRAPDYG